MEDKTIALNMDCMAFMADCRDHEFDLAIVDPPYGIFKDENKRGFMAENYANGGHDAHKWDSAPTAEYFAELFRVAKYHIIWGGNYFLDHLGAAPSVIVWDKKTGGNYFADGEFAWTSFPTGTLRIWEYQQCGFFSKEKRQGVERIHPTQKPIDLYKFLLTKYAKPGWTILDTHLGSGSSRIAAYDLGFEFYGTEISEEYHRKQEARFSAHKAQGDLFGPMQEQLFEGVEI
jgi:site-specific DNA-methyltransferase (adenine-specific)